MTYIIDAHQDLAYNMLTLHRDYRLSAHEIRRREKGTPYPARNNGDATLGWPDYQLGKVAVIFATLFIPPKKYNGGDWETETYSTPAEAKPLVQKQMDLYNRLAENGDQFQLIRSQSDLARVLQPWEQDLPGEHPVGLVLLLEGAELLREPDELAEYVEQGLFMVGPVWSGIRYCGGTNEDRPFDAEGRHLLEVMASFGMSLDISHMREHSALTALDLYDGPVMAGHANCRAVNHGQGEERHLTDHAIRHLIERDGVMGVLPYNKFLVSNWDVTLPREAVTINEILMHIDHICQLAGDSKHAAIGTDFDGGFGYPRIPFEMDTIADLQKLKPAFAERGYTEEDIKNIFHNNWKHHLERVLPK